MSNERKLKLEIQQNHSIKKWKVVFGVSQSFTVLFWEKKHDLYFIDPGLMSYGKYMQAKERNSNERKKGQRTELK